MSMLTMQADKLVSMAQDLRELSNGNVNQGFPARAMLLEAADMMREAADTIESLRDRLQPVPAELDYIEDKSRWFELFGTPEKVAQTLSITIKCFEPATACHDCIYKSYCNTQCDYNALLEWLRGDA